MSWGAGGGAIMTGGTDFRALHITYGAGAAFRWTAAGPATPFSLVVRAEEPIDFLYKLLHAYASVTYGNDPFNAGSEFFGLAMGATWAQYDFGYHGYYSGSYVAHAFGFSIHKDLAGAQLIEALPAHEEGPKPPPSTTPTIPALPVNPILPLPLPPLPQLPPPLESPNVKPECTTDMDCPGDNVCDEGRCLPPL
jgi:Cys-rich repeat protein